MPEQSLQMARTLSDQQTEAFSLSFLGVFTLLQGSVGEGTPLLEQSLALYRALGDKIGQATTMEWLSINHSDLERATAFARESLGLYRELGHLSGIAASLTLVSAINVVEWRFFFTRPMVGRSTLDFSSTRRSDKRRRGSHACLGILLIGRVITSRQMHTIKKPLSE